MNAGDRPFVTFRWQTSESNDFIPYSHHPYAYALGNPVSLTDPTGKCVPYVEKDCRPFWETGGGPNWADGGQYAWDVFQGIGSPGAMIADGLGLSDGHATERIFREGGVGTYLGAGFTGLTLVAAAPTVVIRGQAFLMTHPVAAATLSVGTGALALGGTGYTAYQGIICNDPYAQTALANPGALGLPYMWHELGEALLAAKQGLPVVGRGISDWWKAYNAEAQKLGIVPKGFGSGGIVVGPDGVTMYHYTDANGFEGISNRGVIQADAQNRVYVTPDQIAPEDALNELFAGNPAYRGKGEYVAEFTVREGVELHFGTQGNELIHYGSLRNGRQIDIIYLGKNNFRPQ